MRILPISRVSNYTNQQTQRPSRQTWRRHRHHAHRHHEHFDIPLITIVGSPNVGKSVLFNQLTGAYVTVSNYPGTTVEITHGWAHLDGFESRVIDTPGMYNLLPITEEEAVARQILFQENPAVVVHVVDAKNLQRMLPMTLQLIEAGLPLILAVNVMDEAERLGIQIDLVHLQERLGIPVVGTALANRRGLKELKETITASLQEPAVPVPSQPAANSLIQYPKAIESAIGRISPQLEHNYPLSRRTMALLLLQGDPEAIRQIQAHESQNAAAILAEIQQVELSAAQPLSFQIPLARAQAANAILLPLFKMPDALPSPSVRKKTRSLGERLSDAMIHPLTGFPILLLAIYLTYLFVGVLGAQVLVEWIEAGLFEQYINPWVNQFLVTRVPWPAIQSLIGGEFGIVTLGIRYAIAIILPIVGTFFIAFSVIEDSGYLPRLAMLVDRFFKKIGLNGRAVIPIVLGFGCDTMATITTRTLETRRERIISTLILSLAIPCSAQFGVMLALLSVQTWLLVAWLGIIGGVLLLVGYLSAKLLPGEKPTFYMELPPLRMPTFRNVLVKTYTRIEWYFREVFPIFILASVLIWFGNLTGLFDLLIRMMIPLVSLLGLPEETGVAFLFGFLRRDYGAAGLYDMRNSLSAAQTLVAVVTMTLFIPCLAQFVVAIKERGWKVALGMALFIFPFALLVGWLVSVVLRALGVPGI